jgi:HK97 gp10 family phage protein
MATVRILKDNRAAIRAQIRTALVSILSEAAEGIETQAKSIVPVDTGALRDSILAAPSGVLRFSVTANRDYAGFVELGTSRQGAQPYLMPSALYIAGLLPSIARRNLASVR